MAKKCLNCLFRAHFEEQDFNLIDYFCCLKGEFIKDINKSCKDWVIRKCIVWDIVNKECDKLDRTDETTIII